MPPFPPSLLYTYPVPQNPLNGPPVRQDCHWTSFNFFRDQPDARFNDPNYITDKLKTDYYLVAVEPRYGDLVLFITPDFRIIHSAVFIADNVVYTKNGPNPVRPWILLTISDLLDLYSFDVPPG